MKKMLKEYNALGTDINLQELKHVIERELGVNIHAKTRKRHIVDARRIFFYLARKHTRFSLSVLGGYFNLDHATALHGIRSAKDFIKTDEEFREILYNLEDIVLGRKRSIYKKPIFTQQPKVIHPFRLRYAQKPLRKILIQRR